MLVHVLETRWITFNHPFHPTHLLIFNASIFFLCSTQFLQRCWIILCNALYIIFGKLSTKPLALPLSPCHSDATSSTTDLRRMPTPSVQVHMRVM